MPILDPVYEEHLVTCEKGTWQLGSMEFAWWPDDEPYPECIVITSWKHPVYLLAPVRENESELRVKFLKRSWRNSPPLVGHPPFFMILRDGAWKSTWARQV